MDHDLIDLTGLPQEVIEREKKTREAAKSALRGPHGSVIMDELARFCRADRSCFELTPGGTFDPLRLAQLEGRREVYLHLMALINSGEIIA